MSTDFYCVFSTPTSNDVVAQRENGPNGKTPYTNKTPINPKFQCPAAKNPYRLGYIDVILLLYAFQMVSLNIWNQNILTRVTNQEALLNASISKKRPDACISELDGLYFDASLGFAEVKPSSQKQNKKAVSRDLIRLGMFAKNTFGECSLRGCLTVQVVGYKATFYITSNPSNQLYTMFELCTITIPPSIAGLLNYTTQLDEILSILQCYDNHCNHLTTEEILGSSKRDTLSDEEFDAIASVNKSNKRRCYTVH